MTLSSADLGPQITIVPGKVHCSACGAEVMAVDPHTDWPAKGHAVASYHGNVLARCTRDLDPIWWTTARTPEDLPEVPGLPGEYGPPVSYRHWSRRIREVPVADSYHRLGVAPQPETPWQWFGHDLHHGRLMRYPWPSVIAYSLAGLAEQFITRYRRWTDYE